jgi:Zn-dependent protease with chaperone function
LKWPAAGDTTSTVNFFEAQESARRSTTLLVTLFVLAVIGLVLLSNLIVFVFIYYTETQTFTLSPDELSRVYDNQLSLVISTAIVAFIALGSLYKLAVLSSGGAAIAQSLGGTIIPRGSTDPAHRKILNVVEEMAIASGTPVPQVYLLNEAGINAFAAGWKTTNAVIGITRGALERLNRDELQGVIAHEFSHIFNGDMRLNIRLIAILHGILMIGQLGRMIIRSLRYARRSRGRSDGRALIVILSIGAGMMLVGYTGTFFGSWIKSLISRQREYLADASAVQFTRSTEGISNALKKIGGAVPGSTILAASMEEYSHAYFARGDNSAMHWLSFSTHPPLKKRILRIEPGWDGRYLFDERKPSPVEPVDDTDKQGRKSKAATIAAAVAAGMKIEDAVGLISEIGKVSQDQIDAAQLWYQQMPDEILEHAENPYGAQALILALLLHTDSSLKQNQIETLNQLITELHTANVIKVCDLVRQHTEQQVLPLIDICLPTLREMSPEQYARFKDAVIKMILADNRTTIREWIIQRLVLQHLDEHYHVRRKPVASYFILGAAKPAIEFILTMLADLEHADETQARDAFDSAKRSIAAAALEYRQHQNVTITQLNKAIDELERLKPPIKKRFLEAAVHCLSYNGTVKARSYELLRAIASCIDIPMPPVIVNQ